MTLFLLIPFALLMSVTDERSHGCGQRAYTLTHVGAFASKDDSLHPSLSVVPTIIRTIGSVVAVRNSLVDIFDVFSWKSTHIATMSLSIGKKEPWPGPKGPLP
jgi:hypothetical protein